MGVETERSQSEAQRVRQDTAIEALVSGTNISQTARVVGVDRRTVEGWLHDAEFVARLNGRRRAVWEGLHDRVRTLVDKALGVFERALDLGDFEAAREALRIWGPAVAQGLRNIGSADPADLRRQAAGAEQLRAIQDRVMSGSNGEDQDEEPPV
jgi:Helix-turn-helix domain